jgi:hypothetical protein
VQKLKQAGTSHLSWLGKNGVTPASPGAIPSAVDVEAISQLPHSKSCPPPPFTPLTIHSATRPHQYQLWLHLYNGYADQHHTFGQGEEETVWQQD